MTEYEAAKSSAHQCNLARYRRLLATPLREEERAFIERLLAEEQAALTLLAGSKAEV